MPGQLRKTIEYALELWKDWNFNRMLGTKRVCGELFFSPHICPSKVRFAGFGKTSLRGKWDEKSWNPRSILPSKVHSCTRLKRKLWVEHGVRKEGIRDLPVQRLVSPVLCQDSSAKLWIDYALEPWKDWPFEMILGITRVFVVRPVPSSTLPLKFLIAGFWVESCERKRKWEK